VRDILGVTAVAAGGQAGGTGQSSPGPTRDAQLKKVARQFEAMFMTEMVHCARPSNQASGVFSSGKSEDTWQMFMDQALGQAASSNGPGGDQSLHRAIVKALHDVDARAAQGTVK
jgi:Rod binding domain-containing protein